MNKPKYPFAHKKGSFHCLSCECCKEMPNTRPKVITVVITFTYQTENVLPLNGVITAFTVAVSNFTTSVPQYLSLKAYTPKPIRLVNSLNFRKKNIIICLKYPLDGHTFFTY